MGLMERGKSTSDVGRNETGLGGVLGTVLIVLLVLWLFGGMGMYR